MKIKSLLTILIISSALIFGQQGELNNLSLENCITIAKKNSKQKQIAENKVEVSQSQLKQAQSGYWPSLELTSKAILQDEPQNFIFPSSTFIIPPIDLGQMVIQIPPFKVPAQDVKLMENKSLITDLTLTYPIFTGGKVSSIIDQVEQSILMAQNNASIAEKEVVFNVKKAYYTVILTEQLLKIGTDAFERFDATYNLTESLYKTGSGTVTKIDYLKNKMSLETFRGIVSDLKSKNEVAISALKYFMGLDPAAEISLKDQDLELVFQVPEENETLNTMLVSNLQLQNLDIASKIYEAKIDEAHSEYFPSLALFGSYHRLDNSYDYGFATKENKNVFTVGLGLQLSLFNGFRTAGKVEENEAELKGIHLQKSFAEESLRLKLNQLLIDLKKSGEKIVSSKEAMIAASENRDLNLRAYQNEMGEVADFIEAQIMEALMMAQYQLALYERTELKASLENLLNK